MKTRKILGTLTLVLVFTLAMGILASAADTPIKVYEDASYAAMGNGKVDVANRTIKDSAFDIELGTAEAGMDNDTSDSKYSHFISGTNGLLMYGQGGSAKTKTSFGFEKVSTGKVVVTYTVNLSGNIPGGSQVGSIICGDNANHTDVIPITTNVLSSKLTIEDEVYTMSHNSDYVFANTIDLDNGTYSITARNSVIATGTIEKNTPINAVYFHLNGGDQWIRIKSMKVEVYAGEASAPAIPDEITESTDANGETRELSADETVTIAESNLLKNATIDATNGKVIIGETTITGIMSFDDEGNIDLATSGDLSFSKATSETHKNQAFVINETIEAGTTEYNVTLAASGYEGTKTVKFDLDGIIAGNVVFTVIITEVPTASTVSVQ